MARREDLENELRRVRSEHTKRHQQVWGDAYYQEARDCKFCQDIEIAVR